MAIKEILLLGDEQLYQRSSLLNVEDSRLAKEIFQDLHDTMMDFKARHGFGRAIAAPQIGALYRMIYLNVEEPIALINPVLTFTDDEMISLWDDCMSFPGLEVLLQRYKRCNIMYLNMEWKEQSMALEGDLAELIQHEYDHLDGILAVQRAENMKAFRFNLTKMSGPDCKL